MIHTAQFVESLRQHNIRFFAGVPDSLLKNFCAYLTATLPPKEHIIAANEGGAVGMSIGYHLATGNIGCVYMQNSGEGNIVNPLLSLADEKIYDIPMLLIIGWRGEPGVKDEPQHITQGELTLPLLDTMHVPYAIIDETWEQQLDNAIRYIHEHNGRYALIVRKGTFSEPHIAPEYQQLPLPLSREEAITTIVTSTDTKDKIVATTGMISRELFELREHQHAGHANDFLTVGGMGHANQIALTIALQHPEQRIWCLDGDGAVLMHMGGMAIIANSEANNLVHVVLNNGAHDSVGGQPTVGLSIDIAKIASAMGYKQTYTVTSNTELTKVLNQIKEASGPILINILVRKGNRPDLGRPTTTPIQNKQAFMAQILKTTDEA
jgi:phosphonopyruvate decarboxylase